MMSGSPSLTVQNSTGMIDTVAKPAWDVLLESVGCDGDAETVTCLKGVDGDLLLQAQTNLSMTYSP